MKSAEATQKKIDKIMEIYEPTEEEDD